MLATAIRNNQAGSSCLDCQTAASNTKEAEEERKCVSKESEEEGGLQRWQRRRR